MSNREYSDHPAALAGLRVLDLSGHRAQLCSRLLADMGADVIKVEPPGGDEARRIGPFVDDRFHLDRSLFFWFYNLNKRSLTLDYTSPRGSEILRQLALSADVLIESSAPGRLEQLSLGWEQLHRANPALIMVSITPFGQTGPYRDYLADDTVLEAMGGMLYVNGFPDQPPVRAVGLQSYHSAAHYGAIGAICALFARETSGEGQWVDISQQEATIAAVESGAVAYLGGQIEVRRGAFHWTRAFDVGPSRDGGHVMYTTLCDWTTLIEWLKGDGKARDLAGSEWDDPLYRRDHAEHLFSVFKEWGKDYAREELIEKAQNLRLPFASARNPEELFGDEQLAARGYFVEIEHPELGRKFRYPGAPYIFSGTPWRVYRRPPLVGEHTCEILHEEAGMNADEVAALAAEAVI